MTEQSYNPNDPAFLFSRSLDEELSDSDRKRLEEALASSKELRAEVDRLAALDRLVKRWGTSKAELDWERLWDRLSSLSSTGWKAGPTKAATGDEDAGYDQLDALLGRWGAKPVDLNWAGFTNAVMAGISAQRRPPAPRRRLILRLAAPLAAAAAIVLVVNRPFFQVQPVQPVAVVMIGPVATLSGAGLRSEATGTAFVSFDRSPVSPVATAPPRISFVSVGSAPMTEWQDESSPL